MKYKNISIQYPNRIDDGYGMKKQHVDSMKAKDINLIITVDNGVSSLQEAKYIKEL